MVKCMTLISQNSFLYYADRLKQLNGAVLATFGTKVTPLDSADSDSIAQCIEQIREFIDKGYNCVQWAGILQMAGKGAECPAASNPFVEWTDDQELQLPSGEKI